MAENNNETMLGVKYEFLPWLQKGLSAYIEENDKLAKSGATKKLRPAVTIATTFKKESDGSDGKIATSHKIEKIAELVGPGDITAFYHDAIKQVVPSVGSAEFQYDYYPFMEFYEEDFPWRYTPATPSGEKLRPWIAILLCKDGEFSLQTSSEGLPVLKILADNQEKYSNIFIDPEKTYACAHSQFTNTDFASLDNKGEGITKQLATDPDIGISRLLAVRKEVDSSPLELNTKYMAFLVPAFETGRLRGLGEKTDSIKDTLAQLHAWEKEYSDQTTRKRGLEFPVYYFWNFETQGESFDALARKLTAISSEKQKTLKFPASISVDVSNMGEGFDYDKLIDNNKAVEAPKRKNINVSVATVPQTFAKNIGEDIGYPKYIDEVVIKNHLQELLSQNYVLSETNNIYDGDDDPLITPPLYGARQISAKTLSPTNKPWFNELNMDIRYRVAAGLGKKVIQQNQEEFVHRAWDIVEKINEQNQKIRQTVFGANARRALVKKRFVTDENNLKSTLMFKAASMKRTKVGNTGITLENVLSAEQLNARASSTAAVTANNLCMVTGVSSDVMTKQLAKSNIIGFKEHKVVDLISIEKIKSIFTKPSNSNVDRTLPTHLYDLFLKKYPFMNTEFDNQIISTKKQGVNVKNLLGYLFAIKQIDNITDGKPFVDHDKFKDANFINPASWVYNNADSNTLSNYNLSKWEYCRDLEKRSLGSAKTLFKEMTSNLLSDQKISVTSLVCDKSITWNTSFKARTTYPATAFRESEDYYHYMFRGFTNKYDRERRNVIMLSQAEYNKLFDEYSLCSNIGGVSGMYFVSDKILYQTLYCTPYLIVQYTKEKNNDNVIYKGYFPMDTLILGSANGKYQVINKETTILKNSSNNLNGVAVGFVDNNENSISYFDDYTYSGLKNPDDLDYNLFVIDTSEKKDKKDGIQFYNNEYTRYRLLDKFHIPNDMIDSILHRPDTFEINLTNLKGVAKYEEYATPLEWYRKWCPDLRYDERIHNEKIRTLKALEPILLAHFIQKESEYPPKVNTYDIPQITITLSDGKFETYTSSEALSIIADGLGAPISRDGSTLSQYPMLVYPQFPDPVYYYLKALSARYILPCVDDLPQNSITMFKNNMVFEQAFLCGMNTEMGSELLWREYPTDGRGSYFRKFWDTDSDKLVYGADEEYFDIKPVDKWKFALGSANNCQSANSGEMIIFAIKGDLIRNYPCTQVYLHKGKITSDRYIVLDENESAPDFKYEPEMSVLLKEDVYLVGFRVPLNDIKGTASKPGYFLTFKERMGETRFGVGEDSNSKKVTFETLSSKSNNQAALVAKELLNYPSLYGKHICQFT